VRLVDDDSKVHAMSGTAATAVGVESGEDVDEADAAADREGTCDVPTVALAKADIVAVGDAREDGDGSDEDDDEAEGTGADVVAKNFTSSTYSTTVVAADGALASMRICTTLAATAGTQPTLGSATLTGVHAVVDAAVVTPADVHATDVMGTLVVSDVPTG
jgi:hypothetical protein